jgi:large subunit ribosomal protein L25
MDGQVPGVVYGQGQEPVLVQAEHKLLERVYHQAGHNQLVEFELAGDGAKNVLFHEVQIDPLSRQIRHFDLYTVKMDEKIKTEVPLHFISEAPAVHKLSAILVKNIESVEVEALPVKLPDKIEVDLSGLEEIGQSITVGQLKMDEGVSLLTDPETLVVKTDPPRSEEELAELEEEVAEDAEAAVAAEHGGEEEAAEEGKAEEAESEGTAAEEDKPQQPKEDQSD